MQIVFMMKSVKWFGWTVLSALSYALILVIVQLLTFGLWELPLIVNHILLFAFSLIVGLVFSGWYSLTGCGVFTFVISAWMYFDGNLTLELINAMVLILAGGATGAFFMLKRRLFGIGSFLLGTVTLIIAYQQYSTIEVEKISESGRYNIDDFNSVVTQFVSIDGTKMRLSLDTVYLVNFTFYSCKPCRDKKKVLRELKLKFNNVPFQLINVHTAEPLSVFKTYYRDSDYAFHNSDSENDKKLGVDSYPCEFIFDKKGNEIRRMKGFSLDAQEDYLETTSLLINKLIDEK